MDPTHDEHVDFGDEKTNYHQGGTIPALAEDELIGEDDEYDDLYNDVNVGEGFQQMQQSQMQPSAADDGGFQASNANVLGHRAESMVSQGADNARVANQGNYVSAAGIQYPEQKTSLPPSGATTQTLDASQRGRLPDMGHNSQSVPLGYQGSIPTPPKFGDDGMNRSEKVVGEIPPARYPNVGSSHGAPQIPTNSMNLNPNVNVHRSADDDYTVRPTVENGNTMLFVGELHWWTTDAELESVLIQYGKVKEIKFFDERASGKSKGYCQVEFYDPAAAAACKEGMHGYVFNGRSCVVTFATPQTIKQMGSSYGNKNQVQAQSQSAGRNPFNDGVGRGNGTNYGSGDTGRNFGRGGWGRGGNQAPNKGFGPGGGPVRGRGGMGNKNMMGNAPAQAFGQGLPGPGFGGPPGLMHPQGMMGPGFDLAFMGRGAGYGGFSGAFPGMVPTYPSVNSMGLPGVAPHMNPAFFGRGMTPNGMGMMASSGMDGPPSGMWNDPNMGGWGGEENSRGGARESSYGGGEDNASEYGYGEASHDKGAKSSAASREKERNSERDRSGNHEKRHRDERDYDGDRYDRDHKHREEKERHRDYRHKDRDNDEDWDRGQSSRSRSRSHAVPEEDHRSRSRDADYGKRRRMPSE